MKKQTFFALTSFIFALVALMHVFRLVYSWPAVMGSWNIPIWVSMIGVVVAGFLSYSAYRLMKSK